MREFGIFSRDFVVALTFATSFVSSSGVAEEFGRAEHGVGVEFPLGEISFADRVVSYGAGEFADFPYDNPISSIGVPDYIEQEDKNLPDNTVSLGDAGVLVVEFVNNRLVDQNEVEDGLDLWIFEAGAEEPMFVEISKDGNAWASLGEISGQPKGLDISNVAGPGDEFRFVRLTDANGLQSTGRNYAGVDIDAVGAIGAVVPETSPATLLLVGLFGLLSLRCQLSRL